MEPDEIYADYAFWRHEGLNPIATVETYTTLLLDARLGELNEQQKKWLEIILRNSREARKGWDDFGEYLQARLHVQKSEEQPRFLADAIRNALTFNAQRYKYSVEIENIKVKIPASLQSAKVSPEFEIVFFYLLAPAFKWLDAHESVEKNTPQITAHTKTAQTIAIQIRSVVEHFHLPEKTANRFPYSNMDINLAHFILQQNGIALKIEIIAGEDEAITTLDFKFDLPIWQAGA